MPDKIKNVLLISLEDLNDWIEPLGGHPDAKTPNLTRLAARSVVFTNAQAPAPACCPSRNATMFGQAPWRTGLYNNSHKWNKVYKDSSTSLPGVAKAAGWKTRGSGKIFYRRIKDGQAWSAQHTREDKHDPDAPPLSRMVSETSLRRHEDFGPYDGWCSESDRDLLRWVIGRMRPGAKKVMWALGLTSTHLPFTAPPAFFSGIPDKPALPPCITGEQFDPADEDEYAGVSTGGMTLLEPRMERGKLLKEFDEYDDFLRAYLACVAFTDSLVGELLDHLEKTGLLDTTLIVLWSDHGWQFGEKQAFSKFTLWDRALRVPFMFSGPGITPRRVDSPVSLLDLYPTVAALLGLEPPHELDGQDLSSVLLHGDEPVGEAISAYAMNSALREPSVSIRTRDFRFTRYGDGSSELYDHSNDMCEHTNLLAADSGDNLSAIVTNLTARLPTDLVRPQSKES